MCFFDNPKEFDEIVQLLKATVNQFDLDMMCLTNCDFSGGLDALTSAGAAPHQKNNMAFILGTRLAATSRGAMTCATVPYEAKTHF